MILLLDTSTPVCHLTLVDDRQNGYEWQADRELAKGLLRYIHTTLEKHNSTWQNLSGIGVMKGPGSFTGLRIGMSVCNTLADNLQIPIVGETGDNWQAAALARLGAGENEKVVLPEYGRPANITTPRK